MKLFLTVTRKGLAVALAAVLIIFALLSVTASLKASAIDGSTHRKRMVYIKGLNISVDEDSFTYKKTVIPKEFGSVYNNYNKLQRKAGFDLSRFKGEEVTVYTYPVLGCEKNLTLIVCDGEIIGGDISEVSVNGEMLPLKGK